MKYYLYRWSVQDRDCNPYQAPELRRMCLVGFRDTDPAAVRTSSVASVIGREITTTTGSVYILQDMDTDFRDWLHENGLEFDPVNPIKIRK